MHSRLHHILIALRARLELATNDLTGRRSTIELPQNTKKAAKTLGSGGLMDERASTSQPIGPPQSSKLLKNVTMQVSWQKYVRSSRGLLRFSARTFLQKHHAVLVARTAKESILGPALPRRRLVTEITGRMLFFVYSLYDHVDPAA